MNPAQRRSDTAFFEGILCAPACLPQPDLGILHRGLGERLAGSPITLGLPDLAEAVAACAENLEQPTPSFAFDQDDQDDQDSALAWLEGLFLGIGLYGEEWKSALEGRPGSLMAVALLGSLAKPEATNSLPGVAAAARDLADSPAGIIQLVQTIYFDLRRPPSDPDAWPEAADGDAFDPEQPAPAPPMHHAAKVGRNDPCPCGSGKKFKKCCLNKP